MKSTPTNELRWNGDVLEQKFTRPGRDWEGCECKIIEWLPVPTFDNGNIVECLGDDK